MKHNWEYKRLGDVCDFERGVTYTKSDENQEPTSVVILRSNNINLSNSVLNLDNLKYLREDFELKDNKTLKKNSILICMSNGSIEHVGKTAFIDKDSNYGFGGFMGLIKPFGEIPKYIYYVFKSSIFSNFLSNLNRGANIRNLQFSKLEKLLIPVPPREVQEQIVSELDTITEGIAALREQVADLDRLAQTLFYETFGDPISNPKGWPVMKLGEVCNLKAGKAISAKDLTENKSSGLYPCYGGNGIRGFIDRKSHSGNYSIIGRQGALCGNVSLAQGDFYATEHAIVVTPTIESNFIWMYTVLKELNLNRYAKGAAQPGISVGVLNEIDIPVPPLSLQQRFAEQIEAIEAMKATLATQIADAQTLLDSRMDHWFN
ncbi:MAG: restriction endonuclease subunit S [Muribaculaceae bacterium]|nr:restriction endonuclease subunit S [Muribaculaceae bacterium]